MDKTYYEILNLTTDATLKDIQDAVNKLKYGNESERAEISEWPKIDEAYKVLSDPLSRKEYDSTIIVPQNKIEPTNTNYNKIIEESPTKTSYGEINLVSKPKKSKIYNTNLGSTIKTNTNSKYRIVLESCIKNSLNNENKLKELKTKYINYIELLKQEIKVKENQVVKKGKKLVYKLELKTLNDELNMSLGNIGITK